MANFFSFFTKQLFPSYLGVDIGTTSLKIVEVEQGKQAPRLTNYALLESQGSLARANMAFQTSSLKLFDQDIITFLRAALDRMKPNATNVIASIPGFSAFTTVIDFPEMSDGELSQAIAFKAKQYIPLPISEVAIEPIKVGSYEDARGIRYDQVLLVSVPKEHIKKYQKIFKEAGLSLGALEIEGLSLARSAVGSDPTPTCVVDIGSRSTAIAVVAGGQLKLTTQSDFAGTSLTQALATSLNINPFRAEEMKRERGISGTGAQYELSTIMVPFLDAIIGEVRRAQFNYASQFPSDPKVERVILSGGGANLLGIDKYFGHQLGIPVVKANPFLRFEYAPPLEPLLPELNPLLCVALGLTLREFS
ncbi:MAG: hypothetical protein A3A43_00850 [Candidatus Liptonbacteria bacterium RIFCSPLOWO2_01_FULL_56_20]|uniref:SHS2 domain-containing protein n=1 Tax=Candidatus Liptonbacteria bacterium RIFCSPLOWO2_01_FULL_56_20 TaxID=1798652 RepID=A0A1G2CH58_9BACT|nr:MAG: hypothetical protein UY96_C0020G0004 [Parcubacteria group bacterium GW2011_GWB1_56_8]OGY98314.1 MAG: hypothetical protein A2681_01310 [Candidatus Liptonbacteria bacterium RIFCSPHIGHO2_01_FULL_56_18b]OGZ00725.1 MAG: hypothetical protein A3A43_00850 [Candidatus Liptonbacteria bacterium RIFCSPLOWO2_01_FULL_56_20]